MEQENHIAPMSNFSVDSSINNLSFSVANLSLGNDDVGSFYFGNIGSLAFNDDCSASGTQETNAHLQEKRLENSRTRVLTPSENSRINGANYAGSFCGYNDMYYRQIYYDGSSTFTVEESGENSGLVRQDSTPATQIQERFNNYVIGVGGLTLIKFASSELGSKSLQDILASDKSHLTGLLLSRMIALENQTPVICYLIVSQHGCYVCSKLINLCNDQQLELILKTITRNMELFVSICCNINGAKTIKKLIRLVRRSSLIHYLTRSLCMNFHQLMVDPIGSYVVVLCLDLLDVKQNVSLYESAISYGLTLATDPTGCVSVNNFINRIQGPHRQILLELISNNAVFLSQDPSGNHVVQKVLGLENPIYSAIIGSLLRGHYAKLSFQKWGSHVVEKCLTSQAMNYAVDDLLACSSNQLLQISRDQFGNYVIQKALKVTKKRNNALHVRLVNKIEPNMEALQNGYGKRVYRLIIDGVPLDA